MLLDKVRYLMNDFHYEIGNIDSTIILEEPKISTFIPEMRKVIATILMSKLITSRSKRQLRRDWAMSVEKKDVPPTQLFSLLKRKIMLEQIISYIGTLDPTLIYLVLFFFAFIENIFPPSPSDFVVLFVATLIAKSTLGFIPILLITSIGSGVGFIVMYLIGEFLVKKYYAKVDSNSLRKNLSIRQIFFSTSMVTI